MEECEGSGPKDNATRTGLSLGQSLVLAKIYTIKIARLPYLLSYGVKPISDISASDLLDWGAKLSKLLTIICQQLGQVVHSMEETNPAIITSAVLGYFLRSVEPAQLVRLGQMFVTVVAGL